MSDNDVKIALYHLGCAATHKDNLTMSKATLLGIENYINRLEARIGIYETCNARKDEAIKHLEAENERLLQELQYPQVDTVQRLGDVSNDKERT